MSDVMTTTLGEYQALVESQEATITSLTAAINNCITEASQKNDPVYPLVTIYQHRHSKIINILKAALKEQTDE